MQSTELGKIFAKIKSTDIVQELPKWRRMDKLLTIMGPINKLMQAAAITQSDVGKVFVMVKDCASGKIMTRGEFQEADVKDVGGWCHIGEFDVNC